MSAALKLSRLDTLALQVRDAQTVVRLLRDGPAMCDWRERADASNARLIATLEAYFDESERGQR